MTTELTARVRCKPDTRDRLRALKTGDERYEDVLRRLMQKHEDKA